MKSNCSLIMCLTWLKLTKLPCCQVSQTLSGSFRQPEFTHFPRALSPVFLTNSSLPSLCYTSHTSSLIFALSRRPNHPQVIKTITGNHLTFQPTRSAVHTPLSCLSVFSSLKPTQSLVLSHLLNDARTPAVFPSSCYIVFVHYWIIPTSI